MIYIENKRRTIDNIKFKYNSAIIIDITSKASQPYVKFSPFYPIGNIPIPFSSGRTAQSVEGIWQGLKVFEFEGIDHSCFENKTMRNLKRTVRKLGKPLGHQKGLNSQILLSYLDARGEIYLPSYYWVLDNTLQNEIQLLKSEAMKSDIILLDYETNEDTSNPKKPLSHAALVKKYLLNKFPQIESIGLGINHKSPKKNSKIKINDSKDDLVAILIKLLKVKPYTSSELETYTKTSARIISSLLNKITDIERDTKSKKWRFKINNSKLIQLGFDF